MTIEFLEKRPLAANHSLADPISSLERLLYVYDNIIPSSALIPVKGNKLIEKLLSHARERTQFKAFTSPLELYKGYMELFMSLVPRLKDKQVIFLDINNSILTNRYGMTSKQGIDDFAAVSEVAPKFMEMYAYYASQSSSIASSLEDMVFWRMSPYDFPFLLGRDEESHIYHPFLEEVEEYALPYFLKEKFSLGDLKRSMLDVDTLPNYTFNATIFSKTLYRANQQFIESSKEQYERKRESISMEDFIALNEKAIDLNRELMKRKYALITSQLSREPLSYMLENDIGRTLVYLEKPFHNGLGKTKLIKEKLAVPGGKLIDTTKKIPFKRALETKALNKLSGWFHAKYGDETTTPYVFQKGLVNQPPKIFESWKNPGILTLGKLKEVDDAIQRILNPDDYALLVNELKLYSFSVTSIEDVIRRLNDENFLIQSDHRPISWQKELQGRAVHPHSIIDLKSEAKVIVRPSNTGVKCYFGKYISTQKIDWQGMGDNHYNRVGNILHQIGNELNSKSQLEALMQRGIPAIARELYCEVPITHAYEPKEYIWEAAKQQTLKKLQETGNEFFKLVLEQWKKERGSLIVDAGHPDGSLIIEGTQDIIIPDFKRRMAGYYPTPYFPQQLSRYALGIIQGKQLETDHFYTAIVQTPFHPIKYSQHLTSQIKDSGLHRKQKIRMRRVNLEGEFMHTVQKDLVLEYLGNKVIGENKDVGYMIRDMFKEVSETKSPSCNNCFSNDVSSQNYKCRFLMEGIKTAW